MSAEIVAAEAIIDKITLMCAKGHQPKSVRMSEHQRDALLYDAHYQSLKTEPRDTFFGIPVEIALIDSFQIVV